MLFHRLVKSDAQMTFIIVANTPKFHPRLNLGCLFGKIPKGSARFRVKRHETAVCTYFYRTNSIYTQIEVLLDIFVLTIPISLR